MYSARLHVEDYDDDFVLLQGGSPVREGSVSDEFLGGTPCTALLALLEDIGVTDYNMCHKPGHVPESFRHVKSVEDMLEDLRNLAAAGVVIDEDLHLGGNWDVTFVINELANSVPVAANTHASTNKKNMTEYILPTVPERCTQAFTDYAIKVMQSGGPWLAIFRDDETKEIHPTTLPSWNWAEWDYFIKADCIPKPIDMPENLKKGDLLTTETGEVVTVVNVWGCDDGFQTTPTSDGYKDWTIVMTGVDHSHVIVDYKPAPKQAKRWYTRDEFRLLFKTWPGIFLVKFEDKPDYLYNAELSMFEDHDWFVSCRRGYAIHGKNFTTAQYSHDGGESWHDFGI